MRLFPIETTAPRDMGGGLEELIRAARELEGRFRRYGLEGEHAFYGIASWYLDKLRPKLGTPSKRLEVGRTRIAPLAAQDGEIRAVLNRMVETDPRGGYLPTFYEHFLGRRFREGSGKFFTPTPVAAAMCCLLPLAEEVTIMDPTCGGGTFLREVSHRWGPSACQLVANDIEPTLVDLTDLVLELGTPSHHTRVVTNSNIYEPDDQFSGWNGQVDYILANPPFSLPLQHVAVSSRLFDLGYRNSDAIFLDVCYELLRAGGRLVCIVPHSVVANGEFSQLRTELERRWTLLGVIGMPEGVFHVASRSSTRADIIILEKGTGRGGKAVFAFASSVGVPLNGRRRTTDDNELERVVGSPPVQRALSTGPRKPAGS